MWIEITDSVVVNGRPHSVGEVIPTDPKSAETLIRLDRAREAQPPADPEVDAGEAAPDEAAVVDEMDQILRPDLVEESKAAPKRRK